MTRLGRGSRRPYPKTIRRKDKSKMAGAFSPEAMKHPLFIGDISRLADKLNHAGGLLKDYWNDFRENMLTDSERRPDMIFLPAVLDDDLVDEAKQVLKRYYLTLPESDTANDFQFHTWCRCGSVMRRAAFFDWLASRGAWTRAEIEEAAECFVGYGFKHAFPVLNGRGRSSNNQALSMALYCAVVGFLFGHKLSDRPTARFLLDYGGGRLPDLIGLFPEDGYGGEGSTYTSHVNTPLAYWTCEFLRQVTGRDLFDTEFRPNGTTLRKMLEIELRLISPSGLLAPWDHYGWQPGRNGSAFAYLARATGDPRYLSLLPSLGLWSDPGCLAWGDDDPMWTLAWWPEEHKDYARRELPTDLFGWFLPKTGAALDDPHRRVRLMQVWDTSAGSIAGICRAQTNPNHLMMDYDGEPVFQDGVPVEGTDPWHYPAERVLQRLSDRERERFLKYRTSIQGSKSSLANIVTGQSAGLIGAANAIVIDDQPWYWPGSSRVGVAQFYARAGGLQAVTADCAKFYQPTYDVTQARRTSLWSDAGFGVVLDTLAAASSHRWQWQAYLRPNVALSGDSARVALPGGKSVLLAWEPGCEVGTVPVEGFPRTDEQRSTRLELVRSGEAARFAVVIAPGAQSASIRCVADNAVEVSIDGRTHRLVVENFSREKRTAGELASSAVFAWLAPDGSVAELDEGMVSGVKDDVHELSDIEADRDLQMPLFEELVAWQAEPREPGETRLSQIDACLAQLPATKPDVEMLLGALRSEHWPVQLAAAEVLGRRGCVEAAPVMRELLEAEHAIPEEVLYPPDDAEPGERSTEDLGKRWRLKAALCTALGRLRDADAVPLLGRILEDSRDFYIVYSCAAQALGRIGGAAALEALQPALLENEANTHFRAHAAVDAIKKQS